MVAAHYGRAGAAQGLLDAGADPGIKNTAGQTALDMAQGAARGVLMGAKKKVGAPPPTPIAQVPAPAVPDQKLTSDVDAPTYHRPEDARKFAVVVGIEKYKSLPAAEFAERDAQAVRAHLEALG